MSRVLWLANVLRSAGLSVIEVDGWQSRGASTFDPSGVICHATAGSRTSTDQGELNVLLNGSTSAPPPIAQILLSREGRWYVVASGRCNHVLARNGVGNTHRIGIEAMNDNRGEVWPVAQYNSYVKGVAAIYRYTEWSLSTLRGHKEHQSEKSDPTFNMDHFRNSVIDELHREDDDMSERLEWMAHCLEYGLETVPDGPVKNREFDVMRKINAIDQDVKAIKTSLAAIRPVLEALSTGTGVDLQAIEDAAFRGAQRAETQ